MEREKSLALLAHNHDFPGPYQLRIVVKGPDAALVVSKLGSSLQAPNKLVSINEKPSRNGKYTSLRVNAHLESPERVLELYEFLQAMDEVLTSM